MIVPAFQLITGLATWRSGARWMAAWLAVAAVRLAVLEAAAPTTYPVLWAASEPVYLALLAAAVNEAYRGLTGPIKRLETLGTIVIACGLLLGVLVSAWTLPPGSGFPQTYRVMLQGKAVAMTVMSGVFLAPWLVYRRFPLALSPNLVWRSRIMVVYLTVFALGYWWMGQKPSRTMLETPNTALSALWFACLAAWLWITKLPREAPGAGQAVISDATDAAAKARAFERRLAEL